MKKLIVLLPVLLLLGCNGDLERFVRDGGEKLIDVISAPISNSSNYSYKISPGRGNAAGTSLSARTVITPTARASVGTTLGARVSIQQNRLQ